MNKNKWIKSTEWFESDVEITFPGDEYSFQINHTSVIDNKTIFLNLYKVNKESNIFLCFKSQKSINQFHNVFNSDKSFLFKKEKWTEYPQILENFLWDFKEKIAELIIREKNNYNLDEELSEDDKDEVEDYTTFFYLDREKSDLKYNAIFENQETHQTIKITINFDKGDKINGYYWNASELEKISISEYVENSWKINTDTDWEQNQYLNDSDSKDVFQKIEKLNVKIPKILEQLF